LLTHLLVVAVVAVGIAPEGTMESFVSTGVVDRARWKVLTNGSSAHLVGMFDWETLP
jgi:hypothetical protein